MKKVVVAGGRDFNDYHLLSENLSKLNWSPDDEIVSGTARGADSLGELYARLHNIKIKQFPAQWDTYGKRAGYLRNIEMEKYCTCGVIFWNGYSKGTKMMIDLLEQSKKPYIVIKYDV